MKNNDAGKFRGCWMFDTHETTYHLDDRNNIVGLECVKIKDQLIGIQTGIQVNGFIGNPGVFAFTEDPDDTSKILNELTHTYKSRINTWLKFEGKKEIQQAA